MIEVLIVGITIALIVITSTFYRGGRRRVHLLRAACIGLFVATLCRGLEPVFNGAGIDLVRCCGNMWCWISRRSRMGPEMRS